MSGKTPRKSDSIVNIITGIALFIIFVAIFFWIYTKAFTYPLVGRCDPDRNSVINSADLGLIAQGWGLSGETDVNVDGLTNSADLAWCGRLFGQWSYPEGPVPDDASIIATIDAQSPAEQTAQVEETNTAVPTATNTPSICPECGLPSATAPVPTP